jgi:type II secretory ATPase GspE/PulE/Tfp pilus assembly ATPase PilB-like protein
VIAEVAAETDEPNLDALVDREISRGQLLTLLEGVLAEAVRSHASAVHFVPRHGRATDVLFRIDGNLSSWKCLEEIRTEAVAAAMKMKTPGMDRYERLAVQEGASAKTADGQPIRITVSSVPVVLRDHPGRFEMIVAKITREPEASWRLETIGLDGSALKAVREVLGIRSGLVVLSGPSGSGLTTTMAAMMRALLTPAVSALAVEESMDLAFEGVNHIRLTPKLSYADALSVIERQDPDVILLGEIRNRQAAEMALHLAMTGKHVFSTLRAPDAPGAVARLQLFGVEPYLLAHGLTLVHAQRLVRRLCMQCRTRQPGTDPRVERLGLAGREPLLYRPLGCATCLNGYNGWIPLHETLLITPGVRSLLTQGGPFQEGRLRAEMDAQGARSLLQAAAPLLQEGLTTVDELWTAIS